jgi:hypothetical protein
MVVVVVVVVVVVAVVIVMVTIAVITAMAMIIVVAIMLVILRIWLIRGRMRRLTHNKERAILAGPCFDRTTESPLLSATMARF